MLNKGARSFCVERRRQVHSRYCEAASFAWRDLSISFGEDRRERARVSWRQPQSQQVALALGLRPILESRAIVQDRVVVNNIYVARAEIHLDIQKRVVGER